MGLRNRTDEFGIYCNRSTTDGAYDQLRLDAATLYPNRNHERERRVTNV